MSRLFAESMSADAEPRVSAALPEDEERRQAHLRQQQLKLLCEQATRSPFAVIIAVFFVAIVVWEFVPAWKVLAWAAVLLLPSAPAPPQKP